MPEAVNIMAEVAAGGDRAKLEKMMEMGQLDAVKYLPMFFEALGKRAAPYIAEYYKTVQFARNKAARANEEYLKNFLEGGASEGMNAVLKAYAYIMERGAGFAKSLGGIFKDAGHVISGIMLMPREFVDWWQGVPRNNNFMEYLFGSSDESKLVSAVDFAWSEIRRIIEDSSISISDSMKRAAEGVQDLMDFFAGLIRVATTAFSVLDGYERAGIEGGGWAIRRATAISRIEGDVEQEANDTQRRTGVRPTRREMNTEVLRRADEWTARNPMPESNTKLTNTGITPGNIASAMTYGTAKLTGTTEGMGYSDWIAGPEGRAKRGVKEPKAKGVGLFKYFNSLGVPSEEPGELTPEEIAKYSRPAGAMGLSMGNTPLPAPEIPSTQAVVSNPKIVVETTTPPVPYNMPTNSPLPPRAIQHYLNVNFVGKMSVDGRVVGDISDIDFITPITEVIDERMRSTLPQFNEIAY